MRAVKKCPGDRICDICGNAGYTENLVICFQCNTASEHIYCMQNVGFVGSDSWCCEKCSAIHGEHHDGKLNSKRKTLYHIDEMGHPGSKKPFPSEDGSPEKRDVGKQQVAAKYLSRSSFNKREPSKVKPLSAEEVVQLTSGAVGRVSTSRVTSRRSFCSSANPSHVPSFRHISHRTNQSKSTSSRAEENFHQRVKIAFDSEVKHPRSNCMLTTENKKIENDQMAGEKVPPVLHVTQTMKRSPSTNVLSPRCNTSTCSRSVYAAPFLYKTDGLGKRQADNILEPTKEEPAEDGDLIEACSPTQKTKLADSECLNSRDIIDKDKKAASDVPTKEEPLKKSDLIGVCSPSQHTRSVDLECLNSGMVDIGDKKKKTASDGEETFAKPHEAYNFKNAQSVEFGVADKALVLHNTTAVNMPPRDSGNISDSETVLKETGFQDKNLAPSLAVHSQQNISNCLTAEVRWRGIFDVLYLDALKKFGMLAHCPRNFSIKVYDMAQQMPTELKLSVVPRPDVWPRAFQSDPPDSDDIGLYFVPSNLMRSQDDFFSFLEWIDLGDFALRAWVGGVELLVFSSKQLPVDSQRILNGLYLWGVFRHVKPKDSTHSKDVPSSVHTVASQPGSSNQSNVPSVGNSKEVGKQVDMVAGVDTSIKKLGVPGVTRLFSSSNAPFVASPADDSVQLKLQQEGDINELDMKPDIVRTKTGVVDRPISRFDEPSAFRVPVSVDATSTSKVASIVSQSVMNIQTSVPLQSDAKELDTKVDAVKGIGIGIGIDLADKSISSPDTPSGFTRPIAIDFPSIAGVSSQHNISSPLNPTADSDIKKVDTKINVVGRTRFIPRLHTPPGFTGPISGDITSHVPIVSKHNSDSQLNFSPECNSTKGDKEIDKAGEIEIGLLDRFIPSLCTSPGLTRSCSVDITSDGLTIVSKRNIDNQLNFSPEFNSTEVDIEIDEAGGIDIGLLDKPNPGFDTSHGSSRPISDDDEERPLAKFSVQRVRDIPQTIFPFFSRNSGMENQNNSCEINHDLPIPSRTVHNSFVSLSSRVGNAITSETYNLLEINEASPAESIPHLEPSSSVNLSMEKNEVQAKDDVCFKNSDHARSLSSGLPFCLPEEEKASSSIEHHGDENAISLAKHGSISTSSFQQKSGISLFDILKAKTQSSSVNSLYEGFAYKETKESEEIDDQGTNYESPFPNSEEQVLSGRTALPLFPAAAEFRSGGIIVNEVNERDVQLNNSKTNGQISPDLSLSRPHYVQDGNVWISAASHEKLKKDNCGASLKLSF